MDQFRKELIVLTPSSLRLLPPRSASAGEMSEYNVEASKAGIPKEKSWNRKGKHCYVQETEGPLFKGVLFKIS